MKPITKQLAIAAFILTSVTVLSLGIRQVRLSAHRANTIESPVIADTGESTPARPSDPENQPQPEQSLGANAEPDHYPADSHTVDAEPDPQHANVSDWDEEAPSDDYYEAHTGSGKHGKAASMTKSFKGDYAKSEGSKGLEKISMGDHDNIYIKGEGQLWYVSNLPDGSTAKMQVQIDDTTGEITVVEGLERISMGDNEDLYITGEGQLWYVSKQPDGSTAKMQVRIDDTTGEITIVGSGENE